MSRKGCKKVPAEVVIPLPPDRASPPGCLGDVVLVRFSGLDMVGVVLLSA